MKLSAVGISAAARASAAVSVVYAAGRGVVVVRSDSPPSAESASKPAASANVTSVGTAYSPGVWFSTYRYSASNVGESTAADAAPGSASAPPVAADSRTNPRRLSSQSVNVWSSMVVDPSRGCENVPRRG